MKQKTNKKTSKIQKTKKTHPRFTQKQTVAQNNNKNKKESIDS